MIKPMIAGLMLCMHAMHGMHDVQFVNHAYEQALELALPDILIKGTRPTMHVAPTVHSIHENTIKTEYTVPIEENKWVICRAQVTGIRVWFLCPQDERDGHCAIGAYNDASNYGGQYTIKELTYAFNSCKRAQRIYQMCVKAANR